jgi:hypothetical protein
MESTTRPLEPREVARLLQSLGAAIETELRSLPEDAQTWHPGPNEWCARECLGHIVEAERRGFNGRIRTLVSESEPALVAWDQRAVARARNDCARSTADLVAEFAALRADSVALVGGLTPADLTRGGAHPHVGYLRVQDLLHEWLHHDRNHFRQMQANLQAYVWPSMANAQGFAGE